MYNHSSRLQACLGPHFLPARTANESLCKLRFALYFFTEFNYSAKTTVTAAVINRPFNANFVFVRLKIFSALFVLPHTNRLHFCTVIYIPCKKVYRIPVTLLLSIPMISTIRDNSPRCTDQFYRRLLS